MLCEIWLPSILEHGFMYLGCFQDNSNARWCPSVPCCGRAVESLDDGYCEPRCECGLSFCFRCGSQPHSPSTCTMWRQWQAKMSDDSETINYLQVTKPTSCCCLSFGQPSHAMSFNRAQCGLLCILISSPIIVCRPIASLARGAIFRSKKM